MKWTGSGSQDWDTATQNWVTNGTATPANFSNGVNVILDDSSTVRTINLANPASPNSVSVNNSTGDPYVISGSPLTGPGDLFKYGTGELQLNSANSFYGAINAQGGKIVVNDLEALGNRDARTRMLLDGAELHVTASSLTERRLGIGPLGGVINVDDGVTFTKVGQADFNGTLTKTGGGTLRFEGYASSTAFAATDLVINGGAVDFTAAISYFNSRPFTPSGNTLMKVTVNTGGTLRFSNENSFGGDYVNLQTSLEQVRVIGGTFELATGFNYFHVGTVGTEGRIVLQGGTLTGSGQIEPAGLAALTPTTFTTLASDQSSYISGSGPLALNPGNSSLILDVADGTAEDDLVVQRTINGSRPLTKNGAGNLVLTANNGFSGTFTVSAGSLTLGNTSGNATGTSAVTMAAGTTLRGHGLSSGGSINTAGTISPGDLTTPTGTLTLPATTLTGTLQIGIDQALADKLQVNGALDITGSTLNVTGTLTEPTYQIVSSAGPITGTFATTSVPSGYTLQYNSNSIVLVSNTAPAYDVWASGLSDPSQGADIEGDGIVNVLEFILNSNATVSSTGDLPKVTTNPAGDLVFTFVRKSSSAYLGAVVEYSTSLAAGSWTTFAGATVQANTPSAGLDTVTATLPASLAGPGHKIFARLRVDVP